MLKSNSVNPRPSCIINTQTDRSQCIRIPKKLQRQKKKSPIPRHIQNIQVRCKKLSGKEYNDACRIAKCVWVWGVSKIRHKFTWRNSSIKKNQKWDEIKQKEENKCSRGICSNAHIITKYHLLHLPPIVSILARRQFLNHEPNVQC